MTTMTAALYGGPEHRRCNRATSGRRPRLTPTERAILWAEQYEADQARLEAARVRAERPGPRPAIY